MKKPSKVKAALLAAIVLTVANFVFSYLVNVLVSMIFAESAGSPVSFALAIMAAGLATAFVVTFSVFILLIDDFPFGRYRLRLRPKNDPAPETFT